MIECTRCGAIATSDDFPIIEPEHWFCNDCIDWSNEDTITNA